MDPRALSQIIQECLLKNNLVTVPGIGHFSAESLPAFFANDGKSICPPSVRLFFRGDVDASNYSFISYYADKWHLDPEGARSEYDKLLSEIVSEISAERCVDLPGLGKFISEGEKKIGFIFEEGVDLFSEVVGLEPIGIKPLRGADLRVEAAKEAMSGTLGNVVAVEGDVGDSVEPDDRSKEDGGGESGQYETPSDEFAERGASDAEKGIAGIGGEADGETQGINGSVVEKSESEREKRGSGWRSFWIVSGLLLVILLILWGLAYMGLFDSLLYTPEELELMNQSDGFR